MPGFRTSFVATTMEVNS